MDFDDYLRMDIRAWLAAMRQGQAEGRRGICECHEVHGRHHRDMRGGR